MLTKIYIDGFRALEKCEVDVSHLTVIAGLNSAGKSSLLQAVDFAKACSRNRAGDWLREHNFNVEDIFSKFTRQTTIKLRLTFCCATTTGEQHAQWEIELRQSSREIETVREKFEFDKHSVIRTEQDVQISGEKNSLLFVDDKAGQTALHLLTTFSRFVQKSTSQPLAWMSNLQTMLKTELENLHILGLILPDSVKRTAGFTPEEEKHVLEEGGRFFAAFFHELDASEQKEINRFLREVVSHTGKISTNTKKFGWRSMRFTENFGDSDIEIPTAGVSDGMVRLLLLAGLSATQFRNSTVFIDEIENGLNPTVLPKVLGWLKQAGLQIVITTHSPLFLAELQDTDYANVHFVYRTKTGGACIAKLPTEDSATLKKLSEYLNLGEVVLTKEFEEWRAQLPNAA